MKKGKKPLGIYVHVPFCKSKCQYCDFYSLPGAGKAAVDDYVKAVCRHITEAGALCPNHQVDTVYFGGGTPSFLGGEALTTIMATIRSAFDVLDDGEITCECNPDSVTPRLLRQLRSEGFNRISLGVQSDDDEMLRRLGRPHDFGDVLNAVDAIRRARFKNLSVDLMYGLPGQTPEDWVSTLTNTVNLLNPEHISCYGLRIEEGTPMWELRRSPEIPDEDAQADMYEKTVQILREHGYAQYEISNFCRRGYHSRHNLRYWEGSEYLGFGPNASSDFGGVRFTCVSSLAGYCRGIQDGSQVLTNVQEMSPRDRAAEYLMLRLRTTAGISREFYETNFRMPFDPIEQYLRQCASYGNAMRRRDGRWRLTAGGFFISNTIMSDILLIQEQSQPLDR